MGTKQTRCISHICYLHKVIIRICHHVPPPMHYVVHIQCTILLHYPVPSLELVSSSLASYLSSCNGFDLITELARF